MQRATHVAGDGYRQETTVDDGVADGVQIRERSRWVSPGRVLGFVLGTALVVVGGVAVVQGGLDSTLNAPLITVLGITHSTGVGLMEIGAGVLLLLAAMGEDSRSFITAVGVVAVVAGILGLAVGTDVRTTVGFGTDTAWLFIVWGAVAVAAGLIPATLRTRRQVVDPRT